MALLHLLLVEDDPLARKQLQMMLERARVRCQLSAHAHEALRSVRLATFDVIATDWHLGASPLDVDGVRLSRLIRELGVATPILLYSGRSWTPIDIARAIDAGADDFMEAPLGRFDEFIARLRGLVRRSSGKIPLQRMHVGGFDVDVAGHRATFDGVELNLTRAQFELLVHFVTHVEKALTYDELYAFRAGHTRASRADRIHVVHEAVRGLRVRLGPGASRIVTVAGVGYRFVID